MPRSAASFRTAWTTERAIAAGRAFYRTHGLYPRTADLCHGLRDSGLPARQTVLRLFGTLVAWNHAVRCGEESPPAGPTKVYRCLRCGQLDDRLRINQRICHVCKHKEGEWGEIPDMTWLNGDAPPQAWRGYADWSFLDYEDQ